MKKPHSYSYIKGSKRRGFFGGYESLWLAKDHLLLLRSSGWADRWRESSRRFYFRDIQALIFCEDKKRRNMSLGLLCPTLFFLILALLFRDIGYLFHIPIAVFFLILTIVQWLKGPTCISQIHTAVQSTRLPCIRMRAAEKLKTQLLPLIEAAQGSFATQHITELQESMHQTVPEKNLAAPSSFFDKKAQKNGRQIIPEFSNSIHLLAFLCMLFQTIAALFTLAKGGPETFFIETLLLLFSLAFLVLALSRQSRSHLRGSLTWVTWLALSSLVFFLLMNFGLLVEIFTNFTDADSIPASEYEIWRLMANVDPAESLFLRLLIRAKILVYAVLGITGLVLSFKAGKRKANTND